MNEPRWNYPEYQQILSVVTTKDELIVKFKDGSKVTLKRGNLLPMNAHSPDWNAMKFNPYEIIVPTSLGETEVPWSTIRLLSDPEFAAYWAQKAEEQARDIGRRLRALRNNRNLTGKEVAERAGISPQSLSRIEKGHHDVVFTTLRKILAAMGCSLKDLSNVQEPPASFENILKRLEDSGIKKEWLFSKILPQNTALHYRAISEENPMNELLSFISRIYKWSPDQILSTDPLAFDSSIVQSIRFKTQSRVQEKQASAYALYAHYLSLLVLQATENLSRSEIPDDPAVIRNQIAELYGPLSFENLLLYLWDKGVPVIPLSDPGTFHGACWNVSGRNIIVLKQITKFQGRWLYDLAHELGHVVNHLSEKNGNIVEIEEISPFNDTDGEWEANEFASSLLFDGRAEKYVEMSVKLAQNKVERLKSAVLQIAASEHISVDLLANYLAFRLSKSNNINWWGTANNLQITEPTPWLLAKQELLKRIKPERLNTIDYDLLIRAMEE